MKLSRTSKVAVLFATLLPMVYMALFFGAFAYTAVGGSEKSPVFDNFGIFIAIHLSVMMLMFLLMAFYIVFLFKTDAVKVEIKALWAIALFMGGPIAMPIFWYLYIWPGHEPADDPVA